MTVVGFLSFLSARRSLDDKLSAAVLMLFGFKRSFQILERKSSSSGYLYIYI